MLQETIVSKVLESLETNLTSRNEVGMPWQLPKCGWEDMRTRVKDFDHTWGNR